MFNSYVSGVYGEALKPVMNEQEARAITDVMENRGSTTDGVEGNTPANMAVVIRVCP
jgi:hypothetical protein